MPGPEPNQTTLYDALVARDPTYDGRFYVGVTSTGVFCRLTCPARKPKPQNCRFFTSVLACLEAGFRPCKRCHPLELKASLSPMVHQLLQALRREPGKRWSEHDLETLGLDPSTVRRAFKKAFGRTFLQVARLERLQVALETLSRGGRVIDAQLEAGFESGSGFRASMLRTVGQTPANLGRPLVKTVDRDDQHPRHLGD